MMKLISVLVVVSLICLLVAFNMPIFTDNIGSQWYWYEVLNSSAWTGFSLSCLIIAKQIKTTGSNVSFARDVKRVRIIVELFLVLSLCPLVNDIAGQPVDRFVTNFIFGGIALIYYAVKILLKWRT